MSIVKNKPAFAVVLAALIIVAIGLVARGVSGPISGGASGPSGGGAGAPEFFRIEVWMSHLPDLNEPFTVTAKLKAFEMDESDAELWVAVSGGVYLDGEDRWHGPLKVGEEKVISATFAVVTEGNHAVGAAASTERYSQRWGQSASNIRFHTTAEGSELGYEERGPQARAFGQGQAVREVGAGRLHIVDTTLLLNTSQDPRIEFVQSKEDVARLQEQGLFPKELRYRWRQLNNVDFPRVFLIAYFDRMRPTPGYLPVFQGPDFAWDNGVVKATYQTFSSPPLEDEANKPVSSVTMRYIGRAVKIPFSDVTPYQGPRSFEFTIDDGPPTSLQVDFPVIAARN